MANARNKAQKTPRGYDGERMSPSHLGIGLEGGYTLSPEICF